MAKRNRAEGWKHAKLTGHDNEKRVAELTKSDKNVQARLLHCAHLHNVQVTGVEYGGLHETNIDSVLDGKTKSKTDMWLLLSNGRKLNISIKKDNGGQVFLISISRFIEGFEKQYHTTLDTHTKRALQLYFGSAEDTEDIIKKIRSKNMDLELRKHRLVADTLRIYDEKLYLNLLSWFNTNVAKIYDFCFSKGLAKHQSDHAEIVWYKNLIGENEMDKMFYLPDIIKNIPMNASYGTRNGGSTIQLPFGFVQWHSPKKVIPGNMQFHHSFEKMSDLISK